MNPIEQRMKLWRILVDHQKYNQFNLVLAELIFRIKHKRNWIRDTLEDMIVFYM